MGPLEWKKLNKQEKQSKDIFSPKTFMWSKRLHIVHLELFSKTMWYSIWNTYLNQKVSHLKPK